MIAFLFIAAAAGPWDEPAPLQSLRDTAACIAQEAPRDAREVLAMDFRSDEYAASLRKIANEHPRCMGLDRRFESSGMLFAGSLAEALLKPYNAAGGLAGRIGFDPSRETIEARSETEQMALCTVLDAPRDIVAVLQTTPGTHEETAAMDPLGPVLGKCLKQGMRVQLNKPAVRAMVALAAYRIVTTPRKATGL